MSVLGEAVSALLWADGGGEFGCLLMTVGFLLILPGVYGLEMGISLLSAVSLEI